MHLRNIMLTISFIGVAFCLSVYFQRDPNVQGQNAIFEQYDAAIVSNESTRTLEDFEKKITPLKLDVIIRGYLDKNRLLGEKTRVMQLNCGDGRVIMRLKKIFPEVEFYCLSQEKTMEFYRRESYIQTALKYDFFTKAELETLELPYVVFQKFDYGRQIPYDDNKFDVIFSHDTIKYIKYSFELFNDILRVLKVGGVSIHSDVLGVLIYDRGALVDFKHAFFELKRRGVDIAPLENPRSLWFKKITIEDRFPLTPHHPIPARIDNIPEASGVQEMGYNLVH